MVEIISREEKGLAARKRLHTTVFCQCFSPCGKFLAVGNNFGQITLFSLTAALSKGATEDSWKPISSFTASDGPVYCSITSDQLLITAGTGDVCAWNWLDVIAKKPKKIWSLARPESSNDRFNNTETNCIVVNKQESSTTLFAGCGDNLVYMWDMESGRCVSSLKGHKDYIHGLALRNNGQECLSASEDGSIRIWDLKQAGEAVQVIEPYKYESCARPQFGKWIGCVAADSAGDWLVCGGGPRLCLWRLQSLEATAVFDTPKSCQKHAMFYEDYIISAGSEPLVYNWSVNGDKRSQMPCTPTSVFSVAVNSHSDNAKIQSVAGNCNNIDICTNFNYRAFSMSVC